MTTIYFWQQMVTPHMASLALTLSQNKHDIVYVAETSLSAQLREM